MPGRSASAETDSALREGAPRLAEPATPGPTARGSALSSPGDREGARIDAAYRRLLVLADMAAVAVAVWTGVVVLAGEMLALTATGGLLMIVVVSKAAGLYDRDQHLLSKNTLDEIPALCRLATLYVFLLWLSDGLLVEGSLGRVDVLGVWGLLLLLVPLARAGARRVARAIVPAERCLVVGDPRGADRLQSRLESSRHLNATIVGVLPLPGEQRKPRIVRSLGELSDLGPALREQHVHRVVLAPGTADSDHVLETVKRVKAMGVKVSVLPRLFEAVESSIEFDDVDGVQLLGLRRAGLTRSSRALKRGMDLAFAGLGLIALSPLLLVVALAVKRSSPGPVLFRQPRIGRGGERFELVKLRTMLHDAEERKEALRGRNETVGLFKIAEDPRVTPLGRFLRRSCIDELPQLWNVLRGQMSLVGPRPLVPDEDELIEGLDRARAEMLPGITGFWQVAGSSRIPMSEMVKIDYLYGANWSPWLDVKIMLRTVAYALAGRGL